MKMYGPAYLINKRSSCNLCCAAFSLLYPAVITDMELTATPGLAHGVASFVEP